MALDLTKLSTERKDQYIRIGRRYSSTDTLDQADQTLSAWKLHGAKLEPFGFIAADAENLGQARELLSRADIGRDQARGSKRVSSTGYVESFAASKTVRRRGRSILSGVASDLQDAGKKEDAAKVEAVLSQTGRLSSSPKVMVKQLELMAAVLSDGAIAATAEKRGGVRAVEALRSAAAALHAADLATAARVGTTFETQHMDLLDGIIIELVRRARDAAEAAAEELAEPALASAFKLDKLYRSRRRSAGSVVTDEDEYDDADDTADDPATA